MLSFEKLSVSNILFAKQQGNMYSFCYYGYQPLEELWTAQSLIQEKRTPVKVYFLNT